MAASTLLSNPNRHRAKDHLPLIRVRIQTRWRATTTATAKAKALIRKTFDISDLLIQNAVGVSHCCGLFYGWNDEFEF
jgi:hypothetical protein